MQITFEFPLSIACKYCLVGVTFCNMSRKINLPEARKLCTMVVSAKRFKSKMGPKRISLSGHCILITALSMHRSVYKYHR